MRKGIYTESCTGSRTHIKRLARKTICFSRSVRSTKKSSELLSKNTCSTDWMHHR
ncbi:hypothetical protein B6E78_10465 [Edwardsiella ictaluri]|nr:hypothetical protein B6E78_10465 [Edwardsiella ictaluri]